MFEPIKEKELQFLLCFFGGAALHSPAPDLEDLQCPLPGLPAVGPRSGKPGAKPPLKMSEESYTGKGHSEIGVLAAAHVTFPKLKSMLKHRAPRIIFPCFPL